MRRQACLSGGLSLACAVILGLLAPPAAADSVWRFHFVPQSQFSVSGGFAGVHFVYDVSGALDLRLDTTHGTATLEHVSAVLHGTGWHDGDDLDAHLPLSHLQGDILSATDIEFSGFDGQHAPVTMTADLSGSSLSLRGHNRPPCCDFFSYALDASLLHVAGDANDDMQVTEHDYHVWRDHYGQTAVAPSLGDFNGNGLVSSGDYTIWADGYTAAQASAVPEPATIVLAALAALGLLAARPVVRVTD